MTGCPTCGTELAAARSLVHPDFEAALRDPRGSWSCAGCLGVVVEEDDGDVSTRVPGSVVIRAIEHLRRARDDGRLVDEATRLSRDPATWFVARVPEVFSLFGWRVGAAAKLTDTCFVIAPDTRRAVHDVEGDIQVDPWAGNAPDYGVASRVFDRFLRRPEEVVPGRDWKSLSGLLSADAALPVVGVAPPMLVLSGERISIGRFGRDDLARILVYADAAAPTM